MKSSTVKIVRIVSLVLLAVSLLVCADLFRNYLSSTFISENDGIVCVSLLHKFFGMFGDRNWSVQRFYAAFSRSLWVALLIGIENIVLTCCLIFRERKST